MSWDAFVEQTGDWLAAQGLLTPEAGWVVGASGGPDSTVLLHALHGLSRRRGLGWTLHVGHLHHGLRGADADADEELVARTAARLNLPFHQERADIRAVVRERGGSTEEVARERRYEFLERLALRTACDLVAVAHHADDNAETILHRITRGTGLRGLAGMRGVRPIRPGSRVRLVRPLLNRRREEIERLCAECGFETRTDATNSSPEFTRARIRHAVLPMLREQINPAVSEALLRLGEQAAWLGTYLEDAAARTFDSLLVSEGPGRVALNTRALLGKPRIIQAEVLRRALSEVTHGEQDLNFSHIEMVLRLAGENVSGKEIHLPGQVVVEKRYGRLEFAPLSGAEQLAEIVPVFVECPGHTELPLLGAQLTAEVHAVDRDTLAQVRHRQNPYEEWIDYDRLRMPLLVRGRRTGDRFWPLGAPGSKSISEFLSDEKVDPVLRVRTGVLCDQDGPVWVIPLRIDERVKLRETSARALRLAIQVAPPRADGR